MNNMNITDSERGSTAFMVMVIGFLILMLAFGFVTVWLWLGAAQRSNTEASLNNTIENGILTAMSSPLLSVKSPDPEALQNTLTQYITAKLNKPDTQVQLEDFQIYTDADKGKPAPFGQYLTIPGASVYVKLSVTWTTPSIFEGAQYVLPYHVQDLIALNRYNSPNGAWN